MIKYKIYICHYPPLVERKEYLDSILPNLGIEYEYSTEYTSYNNIYDNLFSIDKKDIDFKNKNSSVICNSFVFTKALRALCLEHINIYNKINNENLDFGIVLEDDAVFVDDIKNRFCQTINDLPKDPWDVIYITNGCEQREKYLELGRKKNPSINNFVRMEIPYSWTGGGYIIKKETAKLFKDNIYPIVFPPDFELNYLQKRFNSSVYWLENPIIYEGSNQISKDKYKYKSSVNREQNEKI
jgi:hypothetical protein